MRVNIAISQKNHWDSLSTLRHVIPPRSRDGFQGQSLLQVIQSEYRPNMVVAASTYPPADEAPALLRQRPLKDGKATVYVCEGFICQNPVTSRSDLEKL